MITPNLIEAADYIVAVNSAVHDGKTKENRHAEAIYNHIVASVGVKYANEYALAVIVMICRGVGPFKTLTTGERAVSLNELGRLLSFYGKTSITEIKVDGFHHQCCVQRAFTLGAVDKEKFFGAEQPTIKDFKRLIGIYAPHPSVRPIIERFLENNKINEEE